MRNLPRFALVPLAVLVSIVPFTVAPFVGPAAADTAADCEAAFNGGSADGLAYTTNPVERLAYVGQTVSLSGAWDPAAWDSLSSAVACVRVGDTFDDVLGASEAAPANGGDFSHSFTIPEDVEPGTRLCTKILLAGDPAGEATEAVWSSKMHCFEVDRAEEAAPPDEDETTPTTAPPSTTAGSTTTPTQPVASPAAASSTPAGDTPLADTPQGPVPVTPEGGGSPVGTPFDSAGDVPPAGGPVVRPPSTPEALPLLPATGYASLRLLHQGELVLFAGLGLLVLAGRRRRHEAA